MIPKKVTLFELKRSTVLSYKNYLTKRIYPMLPLPLLAEVSGEDTYLQSMVEDVQLPIERIRRIEHGVHTDSFIALDDELREILEAPFVTKIDGLEYQLRGAQLERDGWRINAYELQNRLTDWRAKPWWKRIFTKP